MCVHIYTHCVYIYAYIYICTYVYGERERMYTGEVLVLAKNGMRHCSIYYRNYYCMCIKYNHGSIDNVQNCLTTS